MITRRHLFLGALLPLARVCGLVGGFGPTSAVVAAWVGRHFPDVGAAASVGQIYLQQEPRERSAALLAHELFGHDLSGSLRQAGAERLRARLRARCEQDFCQGDLVVLKGWVVTRTEARLLALLSLSTRATNAARL